MSKALKTVGMVVGAVALVASGVGVIGGIGLATKIGAIAGVVSGVASAAAQITAPKPVARGSITDVIIETEPPRPYMVGESYSAGVLRYQAGYGPTLKKVPNPYLLQVKVFSSAGPVEALVAEQFEFKPIGSYYNGFYASDTQLGARPEATALVPPYGAAPGWTAASKLSGHAAIASNYKFDKDGKVFARGIPPHGAIWRGEKAYDPRLDSTYPGGSGAHRLGDESTYTYSTNPAIQTGTYAYGRYQNGELTFGLGLEAEGIDWAAIVDWANDCDANNWQCHGTLWEGGKNSDIEAQRVQNLDDLCAAGGARWLTAGALLSFDWQRPRVPLATLTDDDWLEEGVDATAVQTIRERMNGVRPQFISPSNNWEQITANEIIGTTYRTEDGQPLTQTWPLNLVKAGGQAGELASYALVDSREIGPINVHVGAEWRFYRPGETITLDSELLGYTGPAVILSRDLDPTTLAVTLSLKTETPAKHDFALGKVATPPPSPTIGQTAEERDAQAFAEREVDYSEVTGTEELEDSIAAATLEIIPDKTGFTYVDGALSPANQTITLSAQVKGVNTAVDWATTPNIKSAADEATFTISNAEMAGNASVVVVATLDGEVKASHTIANIADGAATVGAPTGSPFAGRTVDDVEADITQAKTDIDDLVDTFGNTAASAASAAAAEAARIAAETAQGEAQTSSALAAVYAQNAAALASGNLVADPYLVDTESWYSRGSPSEDASQWFNVPIDGGNGFRFQRGQGPVSSSWWLHKQPVTLSPNRTIRLTLEYRVKAGSTGGAYIVYNSDKVNANYSYVAFSPVRDEQWQTYTVDISSNSMINNVSDNVVRLGFALQHNGVTTGDWGEARFLSFEDVTESKAAAAQAAIAEAQAVIATDKASQASTSESLTAGYRNQALGYRNDANTAASNAADSAQDASDFADASQADAAIANAQAVIATDEAAAAKRSAELAASVGTGHMNANSRFSDWPDGETYPTGWQAYSGPAPTRIAGDGSSPWQLQATALAGSNAGISPNAGQAENQKTVQGGGLYVLEAEVELVSGTFRGAGVHVQFYTVSGSGAGAVHLLFTGNDAKGDPVGDGATGGKYQFAAIATAPANATSYRLYAMDHFSYFNSTVSLNGAGAGYNNTSSANSIKWKMLGIRPANPAEIATKTVLPVMQADVAINTGAIASIEDAAAYFEVIASASGSTPAIVKALAGKNGSEVLWGGDRILIVNPDDEDDWVEVARFEGGVARINEALIRTLAVAPNPSSEVYFPVMLEPRRYLAADGDTVYYDGTSAMDALSLGAIPQIEVTPPSVALAAGEALDVRAINITDKKFELRMKKMIPDTPANVVDSGTVTDAGSGTTPRYQRHKSVVADAYDGNYQFIGTATIERVYYIPEGPGLYQGVYVGSIDVYVTDSANSNSWVKVDTISLNRTINSSSIPPSTTSVNINKVVSTSTAIGQHAGREFGLHLGAGTSSLSWSQVRYTTQTQSGAVSISGNALCKVYPPRQE
ncbi:hypothetical protein AB1K62_14315 [Parasphingorhabdus sp. JC815]|uniref:hypothetical protein n=1 Tax=Parasphingorhabdus sp. JC815 TaxID=3232140 RepID=UPI0034586401